MDSLIATMRCVEDGFKASSEKIIKYDLQVVYTAGLRSLSYFTINVFKSSYTSLRLVFKTILQDVPMTGFKDFEMTSS